MGINPTGTPAPVAAAELSQVISFMTEDKSNDWSDEIKTLESVETELAALRTDNETFRANIGGIDTIVLQSRYARLGRYLAISLGANEEWDNDSITEGAAELWKRMGGEHPLGDQNDVALKHWRALADRFGIEHDGEDEDEDDEETCREEGCENSLDDGEGYDGLCGEHADQAEEAGEWDGE